MNDNCEYAGRSGCLCSICRFARETLEEVEKISAEEIDVLFQEAEKAFKEFENDTGKG